MSPTLKQKAMSYTEGVQALNSFDLGADLDEVCSRLADSLLSLSERFDSVAKHLHSVDLLSLAPPFKPQWEVLRKSFREFVWHFRNNVNFLATRVRMFFTTVLPLIARNSSGSRAHDEKLHVLKSFMNISNDHSKLTRDLATSSMKFNNSLNAFHTSFFKLASQKLTAGQSELKHVCRKLADLEQCGRELYLANGRFSGAGVSHYVYSVLRMGSSTKQKCSTKRKTFLKTALGSPDVAPIGELYEQLDLIQNEIAHAHYTSQICHRKTDALTTAQTTMSQLTSDVMIVVESGLSPLLAVWSRLQNDCLELWHWLQNPKSLPGMPATLTSFIDTNQTLYAVVAGSLDILVKDIDPIHFARA